MRKWWCELYFTAWFWPMTNLRGAAITVLYWIATRRPKGSRWCEAWLKPAVVLLEHDAKRILHMARWASEVGSE